MGVSSTTSKEVEAMLQHVFAQERIIAPEGTEIIYLPPHPSHWLLPARGVAVVQLIGIEEVPEEFLRLAEAWGWRYDRQGKKFYPTE